MRNGDPRSPAWIVRTLKTWTREDEATQARLCLVAIHPVPSLDELRTWTDTQCLLADDWALAVHFSAGDNNNRVPAVPEHLKPYQRTFPLRTAEAITHALVEEMAGDNGCCFHPTTEQLAAMVGGCALMLQAGCHFTDAEISLLAAGEQTECEEHFKKFNGFTEAHEALNDIFENGLECHTEPDRG